MMRRHAPPTPRIQPKARQRSWESLLEPFGDTHAAALARLDAARGQYQRIVAMLGVLKLDPDAPESIELAAAEAAWREATERQHTWGATGTETVVFPKQQCPCPAGTPRDRKCANCGRRACLACQPSGAGSACAQCGGPVWIEGETRPPERRDPQQRDY